eukprot:738701-Prymnesium_polylepis.1
MYYLRSVSERLIDNESWGDEAATAVIGGGGGARAKNDWMLSWLIGEAERVVVLVLGAGSRGRSPALYIAKRPIAKNCKLARKKVGVSSSRSFRARNPKVRESRNCAVELESFPRCNVF